MSSYYPSFSYLGVNSRDKRLVVAHFDADQGESETFMGMEPIYTESADGSRRLDYGAKYNNVAVFRITVIKEDGGDFSVKEVREHLRWLTGCKKNSPLDLCENFIEEFIGDGIIGNFKFATTCDHVVRVYVDGILLNDNQWVFDYTENTIKLVDMPSSGAIIKIAYSKIKYSFIGRITNAWQYKLDARTSGIILEFTSVSPWAYSAKQVVSASISGSKTLTIDNETDDLYSYTPVNVTFTDAETQLLTHTKTIMTGTTIDKWRITSEGVSVYSDSSGFDRIKLVASGATNDTWRSIQSPLVKLPSSWQGKQVTLSAWVWSSNWAGMNAGEYGPIAWTLGLSQGTSNMGYYGTKYNIVKPSEVAFGADAKYDIPLTNSKWIKVWVTFTLNRADLIYPTATETLPNYDFNESTHMFVQFYLRRNGEYRIYAPKLEWGDVATPWGGASGEAARTLNIVNTTIDETTTITNIVENETISMSDNMIITSDNASKVFGNTFNFVFPRLVAGENTLTISGTGDITFQYVYCIKIGDCAMDISVLSDPICSDTGEIILTDTLPFSRISDLPNNFQAYNIQNVYSKSEVDTLISNIQINGSVQINENELNAMLEEELS